MIKTQPGIDQSAHLHARATYPDDHFIQEPLASVLQHEAGESSVIIHGWLMTAVAPWGENAEDAYDQGLVELGLG